MAGGVLEAVRGPTLPDPCRICRNDRDLGDNTSWPVASWIVDAPPMTACSCRSERLVQATYNKSWSPS